jgi:hypothetical protein
MSSEGNPMKTETPGRPDLPFRPELVEQPKKHRGWIIAASILGGLVLLGAGSAINSGEPGTRVVDPVTIEQPVDQPVDSNLELLRGAWNALPQADRDNICAFYNTPPVGITPQLVRVFDNEAHLGYAESERVLNTLLAEEC